MQTSRMPEWQNPSCRTRAGRRACVLGGSAFTLIEVMLAIAIMAVICGTIYQFTGTVIRSSNISLRVDAQEQSFAGLRRLLDAQFAVLPANEIGTFIGVAEEGKHGHHDAIQVVCPAGNALLTPDAHGLYQVTLGLDEIPKGSGHYTLVMERAPWSADDDEGVNVSSGPFKTPVKINAAGVAPSDSVRLLAGVNSLEIAYYDPRLNAWQDKWNDDTMIPSLVRVRLAMENSSAPYEFVEQIPSGGIRRGLPTTIAVPGYSVSGVTGTASRSNGTVPGTNGTVPNLPAGLTVPPPPPGFSPNTPLLLPNGGNASPR